MRADGDEEVIESFSKGMPLPNVFEYLFENASDAIYILDMHGNFVAVNRKAEELTGLKREDFIGKPFRKIIPARSIPKAIKGFLNVIRGKSIRVELELKTASKKTVLVEVTSAPFMSNGKIVGTLGIARDITERKKVEEALVKSEESLRTMLEDAPIGICNTNLRGKITYVNKRFEESIGYSREEIVGKNGFKLGIMSEETLKAFEKRMKERLMGKPSRILVGRFKRKDGEWIWAEVESRVIKKFGVPVGFQLIARDITERKRAEEERKRYEEKLSALNTYSRKLNMAESTEEIYQLTLDAMKETLGFEFADILIVEGKMLCLVAHQGYSKNLPLKLPLDGDKGITVRAARTGKPVLVSDVSEDEAYVEGGEGIRSELAVPIKVGHKVLGVLNVESKELGGFDEKGQELLQILASHAATAISNIERRKDIEKYSSQMASLMKSSAEVIHSTELHQRLQKIAEAIQELGWRRVLIRLTDENLNILNAQDIVGAGLTDEEIEFMWEIRAPGQVWLERFGPEGERFKIGEFYYFPWSDPWVRKVFSQGVLPSNLPIEELGEWDPRDMLCAPLRLADGRFVGILGMDDPVDGKRPTKKSLAPLELFMHQAAVAIENAQLIKDLETAKNQVKEYAKNLEIHAQEIQKSQEKLSALNTYSRKLNTTESMEEIYRLTLDAMEKTLGFENAAFMVVDKDMLYVVDQRGFPEPHSSLKLPLNGSKGGVTVRVAKTGRPIIVPDIEEERDYVEVMPGIRSELDVPVKIGKRVLGVLNVESKKLDAFHGKDQRLLEILASHAATAISNLDRAKNLENYAREIRESQEKFERLFMNNPEASVYMDSTFHISDVNPRFSELFGYSLDEIKGKHINDIIVPNEMIKEGEMLDKKALKGYINYDTVRRRKDGSLVPVSVSAAPISVEDKIIGTVGVYKDIAERKSYEERLSALNIHSQKLNMAESMDEIYRLTLDAIEKTLGFEIAFFMIVDKGILRVVDHRGYPESFSKELPLDGTKKGVSVKVARTGTSINVPDAEKNEDWVVFMPGIRSGLDVPVKIGHEVLGVIGVDSKKLAAFDEKDQKLLEILASHAATAISNLEHAKNLEKQAQEIRESQQRFKGLFMDNPEAAVYVDPDFRILDVNPRFIELFGYSLDEIEGKHVDDVVVPKDKMEEAEMLDREALEGRFYHDTVRRKKDGSLVSVSISVAPIKVEGRRIGSVGLYRDITERKQMEKKLEEYSQHLEELVEKRTKELRETQEQLLKAERLAAMGEVAAMVGHDLRNPLTGIAGATYYLKKKLEPEMDQKTMEMLELVEKGIEHSNSIINDLLEYSREIRLEMIETNPKSLMKEALSLVKAPKNVQVLDSTRSEPKIEVDLERMKRVFVNIIKNAIDAMPEGGVLAITSNESNGSLETTFADTGIGMPKDVIEKIWTPLFTTKAKGLGLGLAICKRFVEAHGGNISVESAVGKGTIFTVTIPIKPKLEGGEKAWLKAPESLLSMTTKA